MLNMTDEAQDCDMTCNMVTCARCRVTRPSYAAVSNATPIMISSKCEILLGHVLQIIIDKKKSMNETLLWNLEYNKIHIFVYPHMTACKSIIIKHETRYFFVECGAKTISIYLYISNQIHK